MITIMAITTNSSTALHWHSLLCCIVDLVSSSLQKELKSQYNSLSELLRHFWSCFPVKTQLLEDKASGLYFSQSSSSPCAAHRRFGGHSFGSVVQFAKLARRAQRKNCSSCLSHAHCLTFSRFTPRTPVSGPNNAFRSNWIPWGEEVILMRLNAMKA